MAFRLGSIEPFDAGTGDWSTYKARLEQFLVANDVEGEPKQVATVLTLIGGPTYGLLVNLLAPEEPAKQKLADIFATLDGHFAPKPLVIAERYRFNKRDQRPGEPLNDYVAELRRLARHCEFGSNLNEHLRDRLVCGLNNPATIRKLLAEANLDLKKAIHIAHATETAARDANELHKETPVPTHQLRAQSAKFKGRYQTHGHGSKPCYRCGGTDHRQEDGGLAHYVNARGKMMSSRLWVASRARAIADHSQTESGRPFLFTFPFETLKSCCVLGCFSGAGRDRTISFHRLPPINRPRLTKVLHNLRTKRVCGASTSSA